MKLKSKSGFSLVELMVVVAIIGILATIAVPNFQRFQARSKQTNAKVELAGIYTAQKAFHAEYSVFHGDLAAMGYVPEGINPTTFAISAQKNRIYATTAGAPVDSDLTDLGLTASGYKGFYPSNCKDGATDIKSKGTVAADAFTAAAIGCPMTVGENANDEWTIDQLRALKNTRAMGTAASGGGGGGGGDR